MHASKLIVIMLMVMGLNACSNTATGMHEDWKENTQKIANATGN